MDGDVKFSWRPNLYFFAFVVDDPIIEVKSQFSARIMPANG